MWFFALTQRLWRALRPLIGPDRLNSVLDKTGLREFKNRYWRFERTLPDGLRLRFRDADRCIIDEIYESGAYGSPKLIKTGDIVVDAGGHIGVFALWAAKRVGETGRVLSFEPGPDNLALLRANVAANALRQVKVFDCALSDHPGEAELYIADSGSNNPAANTLMAADGRNAVRVRLNTLDDIAAVEKLTRVDHLKIDVEGAELLVLKGSARTLKVTGRVIMEVHPERIDPEEVLSFLKEAGFKPEVFSRKPHSWLVEARR